MSEVKIRFATDILRRLGEELNPSPDQGIVELVKNAYDADAIRCRIALNKTETSGGSIVVEDDGSGMDSDDIANGWLILGRSRKQIAERSTLGRVPAGSKGLGRLAALRMGHTATLTSMPRSEPGVRYELVLDWDEFDAADMVDEVDLAINRKSALDTAMRTRIEVSNLRSGITRMDVKRLARALILLADPFGDDPEGFQPELIAPEFDDLSALVKRRYFETADYHLTAQLSNGVARAVVTDWKGGTLWQGDHASIAARRKGERYQCPDAQFDLWAFLLTKANFSVRNATLTEVRSWLEIFGGVHLYQNGLRVSPYGNPGSDWLEMNLRRAQSPEERPSTNNAIGRIAVHDTVGRLVQKTDRSGFIETHDFFELKSFAIDALDWMARRRLDLAETRRSVERIEAPQKSHSDRESVERAIQLAPPPVRPQIVEAFTRYDRSRESEVTTLRREIQLYRTLSTAGITAATFAHESSGNPLKVITNSMSTIERRAKKLLGRRYQEQLERSVQRIWHSVDALSVLASVTMSLLQYRKRRSARVDVHEVIEHVIETFDPFLQGRDVDVIPELGAGSPYLQATEAAIESILANLLNNSLAAFELSDVANRLIVVRTAVVGTHLVVEVLDNGPGIKGIDLHAIWLPGETSKKSGTGLGLAIVRDTVRDLGGQVAAIANGDLGGAQITIELPLLGA